MIDEPGCFPTNSQLSRTGRSRWADEGVEEARRKGSEARAKALVASSRQASFLFGSSSFLGLFLANLDLLRY